MSMPENSKNATRFVVVASIARNDNIERTTFVFEKSASLKEVFDQIFAEGRVGFLAHHDCPLNIEVSPDLTTLPMPQTLSEMLEERAATNITSL